MPEGDVVRLTAARLDAALTGTPLVRSELRWAELGAVSLVGRTVTEVVPYGKHLLARTDDGWTLRSHLRMDGAWWVARTGSPGAAGRSPHVRAVLATSRWTAIGNDLGMLDLVRTRDEHRLLGHLGPDVLAPDLDLAAAALRLREGSDGPGAPVAEALLDQRRVAGLGTIWSAEPLFALRVDPWRAVGSLELTQLEAILAHARARMTRVVEHGLEEAGRAVHGRAGRPCVRCGTTIVVRPARRPPLERPIFFCPRCQAPRDGVSRSA